MSDPHDSEDMPIEDVDQPYTEEFDQSGKVQAEIPIDTYVDVPGEEAEELVEDTVIEGRKVERIPWKEFLGNQFNRLLIFLAMLVVLFFIITLSSRVSSDPSAINPSDVISVGSTSDLLLMLLASVLFIAVLAAITKAILLDRKEAFGIETWRSRKALTTFILTTSFISLVYILLDVALVNIYLVTLPVYVMWAFPEVFDLDISIITEQTDRMAYSDIRALYFTFFLTVLFLFPVGMFVSILTRYGRGFIKKRSETRKKLPTRQLLLYFFLFGLGFLITFAIYSNVFAGRGGIEPLIIAIMGILAILWIVTVLLLLVNLILFLVFVSFSNFLILFPLVFLFYIVPGLVWGIWDVLNILGNDSIENTVYVGLDIAFDPDNISDLGTFEMLGFFFQTVGLNLGNLQRVIQLDFVIIVGLSALVIGFAEGYSILAIFRSLWTGVSIARTGQIAQRSAPRMVVLSTRLIYLGTWLAFIWDQTIVLAIILKEEIGVVLPMVEFPRIFSFITLDFDFASISEYLVVLTVLIVPFYFIITSAFKFLSVGLVVERLKDDKQAYFLLISSAFILIVVNILADISALPEFQGDQGPFLPITLIDVDTTSRLLPFATRMLELLESVALYVGAIVSVGRLIQMAYNRVSN